MHKGRLEAFSDGVIAIIITIMVLELKVPHGAQLADLAAMTHLFLLYALSFIFVGIYWNNHHHLMQSVQHVSGAVLWANMHLLFWLSLVPFATSWMGEHVSEPVPVVVYGIVLLACAIAYTILLKLLLKAHPKDSLLARAIGGDRKGKVSLLIYLVALPFAYVSTYLSYACFVAVALIWLLPDPRIERNMQSETASKTR